MSHVLASTFLSIVGKLRASYTEQDWDMLRLVIKHFMTEEQASDHLEFMNRHGREPSKFRSRKALLASFLQVLDQEGLVSTRFGVIFYR